MIVLDSIFLGLAIEPHLIPLDRVAKLDLIVLDMAAQPNPAVCFD